MKHAIIKVLFLAVISLFTVGGVVAQDAPNRNKTTIVEDALAQLPADNYNTYSQTMTSLSSTGEEGLTSLILMMQSPDVKSNEVVEFAIGGWTNFVANDPVKRNIAANTFTKALKLSLDNEVKAFVIRQLAVIADDAQINDIAKFINNKALSAPAIQTLAGMQSEKANNKLAKALKKASSNDVKINLINALGKNEFHEVESVLLRLLKKKPSDKLKEVLYPAIEKVGTEKSIKPLKVAAENVNYVYQKGNATAAYIGLLKNLTQAKPKEVMLEATELLSTATKLENQNVRIAAMNLLMRNPLSDKFELLNTILNDTSIKFVSSGLNFYTPYADKKGVDAILQKHRQTTASGIKSMLTYWLGNQKVEAAVPEISNLITSTDESLQIAAIRSLVKINNDAALHTLTKQFATKENKLMRLIATYMVTIDNKNLTTILVNAFPTSGVNGKLAILDLLIQRQTINQHPSLVYGLMNSRDKRLKEKGISALLTIMRTSKDPLELSKGTEALTSLIAKSDKTGEEKALHLREIMSFAQNDQQKNEIITQLGNTNSYKALLYVATFLDNNALKENACQAVMELALESPSFLNDTTAKILMKVSKTLNNPDAEYQREAISKFLTEQR